MKYSIKKIKVYPKEPIEWKEGVYLGMSMNNKVFQSPETLNEILRVITKQVDTYSVLVGDYLHRFNEQIFNGCNEVEAIEKSINKGASLVNLFTEVANDHPKSTYKFIYSSEFNHRPDFNKRVSRLEDLFISNKRFQDWINYATSVFLRRHDEIRISKEDAEKLCKAYLIEELVIFEMLSEDGLRVNLYPGNQLPIIKEIVSGRLPDVSKSLERIQAVEIKFRPS